MSAILVTPFLEQGQAPETFTALLADARGLCQTDQRFEKRAAGIEQFIGVKQVEIARIERVEGGLKTEGLLLEAQKWRSRGHSLGFGIGIAVGYATLGQIGFDRRLEYAAIGAVTNLASRLCDEAKAGQIVISQRAYGVVEQWAEARAMEELSLKGFARPVPVVEVLSWRTERDDLILPAVAGATS